MILYQNPPGLLSLFGKMSTYFRILFMYSYPVLMLYFKHITKMEKIVNIKHKECLIAYFSRKGNNYVGGKIVNLKIGNTEVIAGIIQEMVAGNLLETGSPLFLKMISPIIFFSNSTDDPHR